MKNLIDYNRTPLAQLFWFFAAIKHYATTLF